MHGTHTESIHVQQAHVGSSQSAYVICFLMYVYKYNIENKFIKLHSQ